MALLKKMVISAIEPTDGASPKAVLAKAKECAKAKDTRIFARDYMPAMKALMTKGYPAREAARMLVGMGCPFSPATLTQCYWQRS